MIVQRMFFKSLAVTLQFDLVWFLKNDAYWLTLVEDIWHWEDYSEMFHQFFQMVKKLELLQIKQVMAMTITYYW